MEVQGNENTAIPDNSRAPEKEEDEFDLSDITHNEQEKSREEIIAEAEAAAFAE